MELRKKQPKVPHSNSYIKTNLIRESSNRQSSLHYFTNLLGKKSYNSMEAFDDYSLSQKHSFPSDLRDNMDNFYNPAQYKSSNPTCFLKKIEQEKPIFKSFRENYYIISEQSNIPASNLEDFLKAKAVLNQTMQMMGTKKHIWKSSEMATKHIHRQPNQRPMMKFQGNPLVNYKSPPSTTPVRFYIFILIFRSEKLGAEDST